MRNKAVVVTEAQAERLQELNKFLGDAEAYLSYAIRAKIGTAQILETLAHDIGGLYRRELCFSPRVSGYADLQKEARAVEMFARRQVKP